MQNFKIQLKPTSSTARCLNSTLSKFWKTNEKISKYFSTNIRKTSPTAATTKTPMRNFSCNSDVSYQNQQSTSLKSGVILFCHTLQFNGSCQLFGGVNILCVRELCVSNLRHTNNSVGFLVKQERSLANLKKTSLSSGKKMAPTLAPTIKLNNGYEMPVLGLGTYELKKNKGDLALKHAIDVGYRHIDTAYLYRNEELVGKAICDKIAEGVIERKDIFLVTKLWNIHHDPAKVKHAVYKQLDLLGLHYIDLYLMHSPVSYQYVNDETLVPFFNETLQLTDIDYVETYKAMEELVDHGLVKSIGLSNFNSDQVQRILDNSRIKPVTNQIECHPALSQKKMIKFCAARDILVTAYSPLARPKPSKAKPEIYLDEQVQEIALRYRKTIPQVILRYLLDLGTVPIPKSSHPKRLEENFNVFDFTLTSADCAVLDRFNTGERMWKFELARNHKYWPYAKEY